MPNQVTHHVSAGGAVAGGFSPTAVVAAAVAMVEELSGYPAHVVDGIVAGARVIFETVASNAIALKWATTDPTGYLFFVVVVTIILHAAWSAASQRER